MIKTTSEKIICPECKAGHIKKDGFRKTDNRGLIQRYSCKECGFRFVQDNGFYRMRNSPQKITCAIDLFYRGVSTRKIQEHFKAFYPHNSSHKSIYLWVLKYAKIISKFTDQIKVKVGSEVQVDEVEYHRRKCATAKLGAEKNFFIDSVCPETRFLVASNYVKSRNEKQIRKVIEKIKEKSVTQIKVITTDGWRAYEKQIKKVFGYNLHTRQYNIIHNKVIADEKGFNHPIERLHNSLRARTKTFRGFHGSLESANSIMKGLSIYYNFITRHQAIGVCPYELATDLKLNFENKWLELINLSSIN